MKQGLARAIAVLTVAFASVTAHAQTIPDHPHFWGGGWGWGHMIFGPLMMIAFVGAIVVVAVLLIRWLGGGSTAPAAPPPARKTPLDILQERFARGEIDKEEFEERQRLLSG